MSTPIDDLRLDVGMTGTERLRRIAEWARSVTTRLRGAAPVERVEMTFDPAALPLELGVVSPVPAKSVALLSAVGVSATASDNAISGGVVTWAAMDGRVRLASVAALSSGTTYQAVFEVRF